MSERNDEYPEGVVIRDKRRLDPVTGEPRHAAPDPASVPDRATDGGPTPPDVARSGGEKVPKAEALLLEERTRDLQRVQAEYANYRKRVDRDRVALAEAAVGGALIGVLPILDDIDRAREHGDLTGAFKAVADQLEAVLGKLGLVAFGEPGDPFDPAVHEAVLHDESDEVTEPTATKVLRRGYQHGDRLLRPAMVGVTDPKSEAASEPEASSPGDLDTDGPS
ncbi:MAG TPA: nucleotide exchange factor GrpE [Jatrophihabitantaceae bacterium]